MVKVVHILFKIEKNLNGSGFEARRDLARDGDTLYWQFCFLNCLFLFSYSDVYSFEFIFL